jgi:outer membrane cobalamin receptor
VVTDREAAAAGALDLGDAVSRVPGVDVTRFGYAGTMSSISIRGAKASQVLVMQDGRPINQPSTGLADASLEFANEMDRVEVVRGPSGLLYGSNALGGVVNMLTPEPPSAFSVTARAEQGGYNTNSTSIRMGGPVGPGRWLLQHSNAGSDGHRDNSTYAGNSWMLKGSLFSNPRLVVTGTSNESALGLPGVVPSADALVRTPAQAHFGNGDVSSLVDWQRGWNRALHSRLEWTAPGGNEVSLRHSVEGGRVRNRYGLIGYDSMFNPVPTLATSLINNSVQVAEGQDHLVLAPSFDANLVAGGGWRKEHMISSEYQQVESGGNVTDKELIDAGVEVGYAFGEFRFRPFKKLESLGGLVLATGARYDNNSRFGGITNPHAGFAWEAGPVVVKGSAGTAFRAPSLNDLYWPADAFGSGNPGLEPERGRTAEAGIEAAQAGISARVGGFWREIRDQIDWVPDSTGFWRPRNTGKVTTRGAEVEGAVKRGWVSISANATWIDAVQRRMETLAVNPATYAPTVTEERSRRAGFVPKVMSGGMVTVSAPWGTAISLSGKYTGDRKMYLEDSTVPAKVVFREKRLAPFTVLGLRLSQVMAKSIEVYLGVDNLADTAYAEQFGNSLDDGNYPMPGRSWYGGMEARW